MNPESDTTTSSKTVNIHPEWRAALEKSFSQPYFSEIKAFILEEKKAGKRIYPPGNLIFNAFNLTPFQAVKVVILGQDPYHGENQAHGLCFSVPDGIKIPPSLVNIFKEQHADLGINAPSSGNLEKWAARGVLLLNAILTVNASEPASHKAAGWERFTDEVIQTLSDQKAHIVFMLWGNFARDKKKLIDSSKHLVLEAAHPSPFSAYNGFFGCRHFSKANQWLAEQHISPVDWNLC